MILISKCKYAEIIIYNTYLHQRETQHYSTLKENTVNEDGRENRFKDTKFTPTIIIIII